ncbi:MAG TPA: hypothetical protein VGJ07_11450 [Rugosimonospora sp.]
MTTGIEFGIVLRGYARVEVDKLIGRAEEATQSRDPALRAAVRDELRAAKLTSALRGYDRSQVDRVRETFARELEQPYGE